MNPIIYATTSIAADGIFDKFPGARMQLALAHADRSYYISDEVSAELRRRGLLQDHEERPHDETLAALAHLAGE